MVYPVFNKEESFCAKCGKNLYDPESFSNQSYVTSRDNFLIRKFFEFEDGADNIFCDNDCFAAFFSVEEIDIDLEEEE